MNDAPRRSMDSSHDPAITAWVFETILSTRVPDEEGAERDFRTGVVRAVLRRAWRNLDQDANSFGTQTNEDIAGVLGKQRGTVSKFKRAEGLTIEPFIMSLVHLGHSYEPLGRMPSPSAMRIFGYARVIRMLCFFGVREAENGRPPRARRDSGNGITRHKEQRSNEPLLRHIVEFFTLLTCARENSLALRLAPESACEVICERADRVVQAAFAEVPVYDDTLHAKSAYVPWRDADTLLRLDQRTSRLWQFLMASNSEPGAAIPS